MKRVLQLSWKFIRYFIAIYFITSIFFVVLYRFVNPPITPLMLIRVAGQIWDNKPVVLKKKWVSLDHISSHLPLAVIASEDNLFLKHHGFDFESIEKAREYNERKQGKRVRGASTISQQTAKNVFLWPQRSWLRKGLEVYFTVLIELIWGKKRIMEVYLNVVEMGNGIYGAESASQYAFGRKASDISRGQAATIAAILPNPLKWDLRSPTPYIEGRKQWILWNMNNLGSIRF